MQTPRTEFAQALRAIASERGLNPDVILETIKQAIIAAYKKDAREQGEETEEFEFEVELDPTSGEAKVFSWPMVSEEATDEEREKAKKERKDVTPPGFGRIAAQTAKQVIHQKIREAEKGALMDEYSERVGSLVSGMILRFDGPDVRVDLGRAEGIMPKEERVSSERLNPNQRLTFLLKEIIDSPRGKQIILSRSDPNFVQKLFEREVPEISSGSVEIKAISREAGVRAKIAVFSNQSGVDPVGSCVGQKGVRVQAVTNELGGERVDIVPWSDNISDLIKGSLAPAENLNVSLDEDGKVANIKAPEDQLSLAIGRDGQNARLAAKLTGWKIKITAIEGEETDGKEKDSDAEDKEKGESTDKKETKTKKEKIAEDEKSDSEDTKVEKEEETEEKKDSEAAESRGKKEEKEEAEEDKSEKK